MSGEQSSNGAGPVERAIEEYDVVIVGAGPAGLSAAIRLKQLAGEDRDKLRVAIVEKGAALGSHTVSGACMNPCALDELLPQWRTEESAPFKDMVVKETIALLTRNLSITSPWLPSAFSNHHCHLGSLGALVKWMGEKAEGLGVEIFCGFAASKPLYGSKGLEGIILNDVGIDKNGKQTERYQPGMILKGKQIIVAEGCRGSLAKELELHYKLRTCPTTYALGVKELWEVDPSVFAPGTVRHTLGWPLSRSEGHDSHTYGGSWMYHYGKNIMSVGFVTALDYSNPHLRPYMELQKWKTHPSIRKFFEGGKPIAYGARTLNEGGLAGLPKLSFPGGLFVGDTAGFLNSTKIKGIHLAMKSGMVAAESIWKELFQEGQRSAIPNYGAEVSSFTAQVRNSWLHKDLVMFRNVRQVFARKGFFPGIVYAGASALVLRGREPFTLTHHMEDHATLVDPNHVTEIKYPKPDGKLTFDLLSNLFRSGTTHNSDQPPHLKLKDLSRAAAVKNWEQFLGPEERFCPANVYEYIAGEDGKCGLRINFENCLHCKACDIKDPSQNICWTPPEGGNGPEYAGQM